MIHRFARDLAHTARQPSVFRRCSLIAVVVGTLLTVINQFDALTAGLLDLPTIGKIVANYLIPFAVSNFGAMSAMDAERGR